MRTTPHVIAALLACALAGGPSFAAMEGAGNEAAPPNPNELRDQLRAQRNARAAERNEAALAREERRREEEARSYNEMRRHLHGNERGAGPEHQFYRGDRLPPQYNNRYNVVEDWRGPQLRVPPRGYQWVQTGGDYVLVSMATGIIAELLINP